MAFHTPMSIIVAGPVPSNRPGKNGPSMLGSQDLNKIIRHIVDVHVWTTSDQCTKSYGYVGTEYNGWHIQCRGLQHDMHHAFQSEISSNISLTKSSPNEIRKNRESRMIKRTMPFRNDSGGFGSHREYVEKGPHLFFFHWYTKERPFQT
jgi:hypothetical protein